MYIIIGQSTADSMKDKYVVLELESFLNNKNETVTAFCVVAPESIKLEEMQEVDRLCRLHQAFVDAYNSKKYEIAKDVVQYVRGMFSGEVDSFYEYICEQISKIEKEDNEQLPGK